MHFGFSYIGLAFLLLLFIPNMFWSKHKPRGYEEYVGNENKILQSLERAGQMLVCGVSLLCSDFKLRKPDIWTVWLALAIAAMCCYEGYWIRYFRSRKELTDFYSSFLGIPVAGASLPVAAFFFLGIYGRNLLLLLATVVLGIGHIGIHLAHRREAAHRKQRNAENREDPERKAEPEPANRTGVKGET